MYKLLSLLLINGILLSVMAATVRVEESLNACGLAGIQHSPKQEAINTFDDLRLSVTAFQTERGCCVLTKCDKAGSVYTTQRNCVLRARRDRCEFKFHTGRKCDQVDSADPGPLDSQAAVGRGGSGTEPESGLACR